MIRFSRSEFLVVTLALCSSSGAIAQTTVHVNSGQRLRPSDLSAGVFQGQPFTLGPSTTFVVHSGAHFGQTSGSATADFMGSVLNIESGGDVDTPLYTETLTVENVEFNLLTGGTISGIVYAGSGSVFNFLGGTHTGFGGFVAFNGSVVNVSAGSAGEGFLVESGGAVQVTGGNFVAYFSAANGSVVDITGGSFGLRFKALAGSNVQFAGGEFQRNGVAISDLSAGLAPGEIFTGTLEDGSAFIFSTEAADEFAAGTTTLVASSVPPLDLNPILVSSGAGPESLRAGQSLTLSGAGTLKQNFAVVSATLNVEGGVVGAGLEAAYSDVLISGGAVGVGAFLETGGIHYAVTAFDGATVEVVGGEVGAMIAHAGAEILVSDGVTDTLSARDGGHVLMSGGSARSFFVGGNGVLDMTGGEAREFLTVGAGGVLNMSGGSLIQGFQIANGGVMHVSGGDFASDGFLSVTGSALHLEVLDAALDGSPLSINPGQTVEIVERGGSLLSGTLADGSPFSFPLHEALGQGPTFIHPDALLTVTLLDPCPADFNQDDVTDGADLAALLAAWGSPNSPADLSGDGNVDGADLAILLAAWGACS